MLLEFCRLGWQDSNLRVTESKSVALPLGDTPSMNIGFMKVYILGQEGIRTPDNRGS